MIKESFSLVGQPYIWHISPEAKSSQIWGLSWKIKNCNVFSFRLPPEKIMTKLFKNCKKKLVFSTFWGQGQSAFLGNPLQQLIFLTRFLLLYKISEKT